MDHQAGGSGHLDGDETQDAWACSSNVVDAEVHTTHLVDLLAEQDTQPLPHGPSSSDHAHAAATQPLSASHPLVLRHDNRLPEDDTQEEATTKEEPVLVSIAPATEEEEENEEGEEEDRDEKEEVKEIKEENEEEEDAADPHMTSSNEVETAENTDDELVDVDNHHHVAAQAMTATLPGLQVGEPLDIESMSEGELVAHYVGNAESMAGFGQYRFISYQRILESDRGYCSWSLAQQWPQSQAFRRFQDWLGVAERIVCVACCAITNLVPRVHRREPTRGRTYPKTQYTLACTCTTISSRPPAFFLPIPPPPPARTSRHSPASPPGAPAFAAPPP